MAPRLTSKTVAPPLWALWGRTKEGVAPSYEKSEGRRIQ